MRYNRMISNDFHVLIYLSKYSIHFFEKKKGGSFGSPLIGAPGVLSPSHIVVGILRVPLPQRPHIPQGPCFRNPLPNLRTVGCFSTRGK